MNQTEASEMAVRRLYGDSSIHRACVPVRIVYEGNDVWNGVVNVFAVANDPETTIVYAWCHMTDDPEYPVRTSVVPHIHPIESPESAVRVAILEELRALQNPELNLHQRIEVEERRDARKRLKKLRADERSVKS